MATISGLTTLVTSDIGAGDYLPIYDAAAGTDKKTPMFETGSWTPALKFGGATTGITYGGQVGTYTRTGRIVIVAATIILSSKGSATVTGFPYTSLNNANSHFYAASVYWRSLAANGYSIMAILPDNSATISIYASIASANTTGATDAVFGNVSELMLTLMYEAAAS